MYHNLEAEMVRSDIKRKDMASALGVTPTTLGLKLNGKANLTLSECLTIKNLVAPDKTIEYLFEA